MKKKQNPYLIPVAVSLVVGLVLGYSLSYFAPNLGAALAGARKKGSTSFQEALKPSNNNTSATAAANVAQCKQNCEQIGENQCTPTDPNQTFSKTTHAYCQSFNSRRGSTTSVNWTCDLTACGGSQLGELHGVPPTGYVRVSGQSGLVFQDCATVQCNLAVQRGYWSEAFRR